MLESGGIFMVALTLDTGKANITTHVANTIAATYRVNKNHSKTLDARKEAFEITWYYLLFYDDNFLCLGVLFFSFFLKREKNKNKNIYL